MKLTGLRKYWPVVAGIVILIGITIGISKLVYWVEKEKEQKLLKEFDEELVKDIDRTNRTDAYNELIETIKLSYPDINPTWQNDYFQKRFARSALRKNPPTSVELDSVFITHDILLNTTAVDVADAFPNERGYKVVILGKYLRYELLADYEMLEKVYKIELDGIKINPRTNKRIFVINPRQVTSTVDPLTSEPYFTVKGYLSQVYERPAPCHRGESFCNFKG